MSFKKTGKTETIGVIKNQEDKQKREAKSNSENTDKTRKNPEK
jgi:hypothetical protein